MKDFVLLAVTVISSYGPVLAQSEKKFVHVLAGIARRNLTETLTDGTTNFTDHNTNFAMNFGGGVDYKLNDRFAWRIAQFDYDPIFLRSRTFNSVTFPDRTINGFRFSTGIVIK